MKKSINLNKITTPFLEAVPVALALLNQKREMVYRNYAMEEFLLMHDLEDQDNRLLERIAGSGGHSSGISLDPKAAAIFDPDVRNPEPFTTDIAMLGHEGGSNFMLTLKRVVIGSLEKTSPCAILILNDVTMLTRAKIDAEAANRAKSDFLSRMSHEIRTPMNAIIGMTRIAKNTNDSEKSIGCLDHIEKSSSHLLGVINDILDFSKIESKRLVLNIAEFSLAANLDFVISMMNARAKQRNIEISLKVENIRNDVMYTDSFRLNQVLINLLSNAVKFSEDGSAVSLNVRELGSTDGHTTYCFEITDHGIGISEYLASKLFRPFEVGDSSITRKYGGAGLGLAISKNLVEMMGGKISLSSKEGEGSVFSFTIQCISRSKDGEVPEDAQAEEENQTFDFNGKRCLVVDDIDINREILTELLSDTNMTLETAENGGDALNKVKKCGAGFFDLILMDMQMPVMDGCTTTREIRRIEKAWNAENPDAGEIIIIAMTANVLPEDIQRALDSGMNAHIGKPIDLEVVLKTIQKMFRARKSPEIY